MSSYFLVLWVSWACQGDTSVLGIAVRPVPEALRPVAAALAVSGRPVCWPVPEQTYLAGHDAVDRKVKALGPLAGPRVRWCQRLRCWDKPVTWRPELYVDGRKIQ